MYLIKLSHFIRKVVGWLCRDPDNIKAKALRKRRIIILAGECSIECDRVTKLIISPYY